MRKVKIIRYIQDYDFQSVLEYTEWTEVSEEEFGLLNEWIVLNNKKGSPYLALIQDLGPSFVKISLEEMKKIIAPDIEKQKQAEQKKKEAIQKRKETAERKRKEKELKKLEELKAKYETR